jgi:hypothetical protein
MDMYTSQRMGNQYNTHLSIGYIRYLHSSPPLVRTSDYPLSMTGLYAISVPKTLAPDVGRPNPFLRPFGKANETDI